MGRSRMMNERNEKNLNAPICTCDKCEYLRLFYSYGYEKSKTFLKLLA